MFRHRHTAVSHTEYMMNSFHIDSYFSDTPLVLKEICVQNHEQATELSLVEYPVKAN